MLFFSTYLLPLVGFPLITNAWWRSSSSWPFVIVAMGVPGRLRLSAGLVILCIIPTVVFLAVDPPTRHALHARLTGGSR
jgi:hypothetical protein